jgi:hypothetical protein
MKWDNHVKKVVEYVNEAESLDLKHSDKAMSLYKKAGKLQDEIVASLMELKELDGEQIESLRIAAIYHIKSNEVTKAKKYLYHALAYCKDKSLLMQLEDIIKEVLLEGENAPSYNYLKTLRNNAIEYILDPLNPYHGTSISLENIKDFSTYYLAGLKAYGFALAKKINKNIDVINVKKLFTPLVCDLNYGSCKISISMDYISRGETEEFTEIKKDLVKSFHENILNNKLSNEDVATLKKQFSADDLDQIFRPVSKIRSVANSYAVTFINKQTIGRVTIPAISHMQRSILLKKMEVIQEEIGILENIILYKSKDALGKSKSKTIFQEPLKTIDKEITVQEIKPAHYSTILLAKPINIDIHFDEESGFTLRYDELKIESQEKNYNAALTKLHDRIYQRAIYFATHDIEAYEEEQLRIIKTIIPNPRALLKK